jgi:hypothetical protein
VDKLRVLALAALAALAAPATAAAHPRAPAIALDDRATVDRTPAPGVRASIVDGDRKLRLVVAAGVRVVVLGYLGEPMLRLSADEVAASGRSPTALANSLVQSSRAGWLRVGGGPSFAWHDHRLAPRLPSGLSRARWSIPLLVNGRRVSLSGELVRTAKPALWPWVVLGAALVAAGVAVARVRRLELSVAGGTAIAALAGAAGLTSLAGFSLAAAGVVRSRVELAAAVALAAAAVAGLVLGGRRRLAVAGAIGALALVEGLGRLGVFVHGVVVSELPPAAARAAATVAIGGGLAALLIAFTQPTRRPIQARRNR